MPARMGESCPPISTGPARFRRRMRKKRRRPAASASAPTLPHTAAITVLLLFDVALGSDAGVLLEVAEVLLGRTAASVMEGSLSVVVGDALISKVEPSVVTVFVTVAGAIVSPTNVGLGVTIEVTTRVDDCLCEDVDSALEENALCNCPIRSIIR
jgi:hypothetical protein